MTRLRNFVTLAAALLAFGNAPVLMTGRPNCLKPEGKTFQLYQALMYANMPDLSVHGFRPAHVVDRGIWKDEVKRDRLDFAKVSSRLAKLPGKDALIVLDIEHFTLSGDASAVETSVRSLQRLARSAQKTSPRRKVGFYGLLPLSEYWRPINGLKDGGKIDWKRDNGRLAQLGQTVDANLPSLYTYYADRKGWVRQAEALVCEARRLSNKPVLVFLWPQYHPGTELGGKELTGDYWRLQLETSRRIADGVIIWGGYDVVANRQMPWNDDAQWWLETIRFIAEANGG